MLTKEQAIDFLISNPLEYAKMLGFDKLQPLHEKWIIDMARGKEDKSLMAHRGSYKTTCVSIALALIIILLPKTRTVFIRKTDNDVKEVIRQVQKILLDPHTQYLTKCIYKNSVKLTTQSMTEINTNLIIDTKGTSQLVGIGTGGSLTGKHFDRIFTDDIINLTDRISKAERERIKIIYQELQNIKNRGGRIYNTLTPWHKDDASTLMPNIEKYDCYSTGLISEEELAEIKESMIPSLYAANYELRHIASEDVIFQNPVVNGDVSKVQQARFCHIDAAYGGSDYTAFTICRKVDDKYYVFGKLWQKHIDDCIPEILRYRRQFNAGRIYCEENADKGYLAKDLRKQGERVVTYWEDMNKFLKIATYLKKVWKDVIFVEGTDEEYIQQICDFNEEAEHDDAPDSLASLIRLLWQKKNEDENFSPILYPHY